MKNIFLGVFIFISTQLTAQIFNDGFENWTQVADTFLPNGWKPSITWIGTSKSVQRLPALSEGIYSVNIVDSINGFEGPLPYSIRKELANRADTVDITFNYKCVGQGFCAVYLGEAMNSTTPAYHQREVWSVAASGDTATYTATIQDIGVNPPFTLFAALALESRPVITPVYSYGITHFTVDMVAVNARLINSATEPAKETDWKFQNPVSSSIRLFSNSNQTPDWIKVFNPLGELVAQSYNALQANVSHLGAGFYFIEVSKGGESAFVKILKY